MIDRAHPLGLSRQCALLALSRSSLYYRPAPVPAGELALMASIDRIHLAYPFYASRRVRDELRRGGITVGRDHVRTLMRRMGIEAIYRKPRLSDPMPGHKIYILTCCVSSPSNRPTTCGAPTSPICRWRAVSPTWWR